MSNSASRSEASVLSSDEDSDTKIRKASIPKDRDAALPQCDSRRESEKDVLPVGHEYLIDMVALDDKCDRKSLIATHRETGFIAGLELLPRDCGECEEMVGLGRCLRVALARLLSTLRIPRRGALTPGQSP
jgi:hypothetical protein